MRARPNRLVEIFNAFVEFPEAFVVKAKIAGGNHVGRVQGERALVLRDGFLGAPLGPKDVALDIVRPSVVWIEGERLRLQLVCSLQLVFRVGGHTKRRGQKELDTQNHQAADIVGVDGQRLVAERVSCIRLLALPTSGPLKTIAAWKALTESQHGDPRFVEAHERMYDGLRKAGMPEE